jgi:predicted DNA-binding protein (UPF0251 family)
LPAHPFRFQKGQTAFAMERGRKHVQISFDELNRIRILDPEHFKQTEALADECTQFNESQ